MERSNYKIHIIGAGLSGLIAAQVLEDHGYAPVIYEAASEAGGRVRTEIVNGYQLDHGFQVLLNAYPKAKKYLDYEKLELQQIKPGAVIFSDGKMQTIGDPLRDLSLLLPTMLSSVGNLKDKIRILKLNKNLQKKSLQDIFNSEEITTMAYLKQKKFSEDIITNFFKPFFSGIFLETELHTSSRMFEFVYKMFGEGLAVIPKKGIGEIPNQLIKNLNNTTIHFNTLVNQVKEGFIVLENGKRIESHFTIIATEASSLVSNLKGQEISWNSCYNFYYEVEKRSINPPLIGLITDKDALINNIFFHNSVETNSKGDQQLLSISVVKKNNLSDEELRAKVEEDLKRYCQISDFNFIKYFHIKKALPVLKPLYYEMEPTETQLSNTIFLAGDQLLNGSQNAAMLSGERAALGVITALEGGTITGELTSEYI